MGVDKPVEKVYITLVMATAPTKVIRARLKLSTMEALEADADDLGHKPGTLVRLLLEKRYSSAPNGVGKSDIQPAKSTTAEATEEPAWESSPLPKD